LDFIKDLLNVSFHLVLVFSLKAFHLGFHLYFFLEIH